MGVPLALSRIKKCSWGAPFFSWRARALCLRYTPYSFPRGLAVTNRIFTELRLGRSNLRGHRPARYVQTHKGENLSRPPLPVECPSHLPFSARAPFLPFPLLRVCLFDGRGPLLVGWCATGNSGGGGGGGGGGESRYGESRGGGDSYGESRGGSGGSGQSKPRAEAAAPEASNPKIYITGLPPNVTAEQLQATFGMLGTVARKRQKRGYPDQWPFKINVYMEGNKSVSTTDPPTP